MVEGRSESVGMLEIRIEGRRCSSVRGLSDVV